MHERPHHAHSHMNLPWREFVTKPWRGPRKLNDYHLLKESGSYEAVNADMGTSCVSNYTWNEVIPCSTEDFTIIEGYARYMYELMQGVKSFHPTRYEDLYKLGTAGLLQMLEKETGKKAKCEPMEGKGVIKHKDVPKDFIEWMNQFIDWEVEGLVGYSKRKPRSF